MRPALVFAKESTCAPLTCAVSVWVYALANEPTDMSDSATKMWRQTIYPTRDGSFTYFDTSEFSINYLMSRRLRIVAFDY